MEYSIDIIKSNFIDCNCYIIKTRNKNIIIDPCINPIEFLKRGISRVDVILITHSHIDHILYLNEIHDKYKCDIFMTEKAKNNIFNNSINLSNIFNYDLNFNNIENEINIIKNNEIVVDDILIKVINTPGHTNCSVSYLIDSNLFTGDLLFDGSVGKTDFPTGNYDELLKSLKKVCDYQINFKIYPGHNNITTIEEQKQKNQYLKIIER